MAATKTAANGRAGAVQHAHAQAAVDEGMAERVNRLAMEVDYLENHLAALRTVLQKKGITTYDEVLGEMYALERRTATPGARVVARAWTDAAFKQRLLSDPMAACAELGIDLSEYGWELEVCENTDALHNVAVCTTCSCYPGPLVGGAPAWYKSWGFRGYVVDQPRKVLQQFGLTLPERMEVRVVDTNRTHRMFVLPRRPAGTEHLDEAELASLVSQESMFGVAEPHYPQPPK